jgi:helix-turn-helix protein
VDEKEFRATLTKSELEKRALLLPFKITNIEMFEQLTKHSNELSKTYDELINLALTRLFNDIEVIGDLRFPVCDF